MTLPPSLRILDLCEFFSDRGGGVRSYLEREGRAAEQRGHSLTVVAPGAAHQVSRHQGIKLIRYPAPRMPYDSTYRVPWRLDIMSRAVEREQPHVVQVSSPFAPALAGAALGRRPLRVYFYHSDPIGCYARPVLQRVLPPSLAEPAEDWVWGWQRAICRSYDATVVGGHWLAELLKQHGCQRLRVVPFGVSTSDLGPARADAALRRHLMGPLADVSRAALILIAGRLAADKRQSLLLDALLEVQRTRPVALVVLGDGPERARLERKARDLGHATFLPFTHDRLEFAAILASVDALLHGSLCETFGFVVAEAMASGTPIVVPRAGGAFALSHADYAETYPPRASAGEVARTVLRLLARPRAQLSGAALRAAEALPSSNEHFDHLFELYAQLLAERSARA